MFRMKFLSPAVESSTSDDEEDDRCGDSSGRRSSSEAVYFAGKVVKVTKSRPLPRSDKPFVDGHSSLRSLILCPSAQVVPLPGPVTESVEATPLPVEAAVAKSKVGMMDDIPVVVALHNQDSSKDQAPKVIVLQETDACAVLVDAESDSESSECSTPTHQTEADDEALTEIFNKIVEERKRKFQKTVDTVTKPSEEPLLAGHDQEELDLMAKEEAKAEAIRIAEEERLERARELRELRALANCTTVPSPGHSLGRTLAFKKSSKLKKMLNKTGVTTICRFLRSPFRISRRRHTSYPDAREAKVVVPKASFFGGCRTAPGFDAGSTGAQLAMMTRNAPQPGLTRRPNMQFATVQSTQRDGPAWTREEYLRKNGRIPQHVSIRLKEDEEFGGIEGNNLMNQYFDDGVVTDYDSDSD